MASASSSKLVIYAALAGNLLVSITKFGAAAWTGSSAMLSEGVHSLVDTVNQALMLYGIHRASAPPDAQHPLGHGRELYFWSFVVALLIFALGAGVSIYEGVVHILHPEPIENFRVSYVVLGLSFVFEGTTWWIAVRAFSKQRGTLGFIEAATRSRDPTSYLVLFEDSAALAGIAIAVAGTLAVQLTGIEAFDGVASVGIGLLLAATSLFLARESKGLLIGEPAREPARRSILEIADGSPGVSKVGRLITVHLAPHQIVAALDIDFTNDLRASEIEAIAGTIERRIREVNPDVTMVFISPKSITVIGSDPVG
ncbi:MAG: cation transporter [Tardiphaga sp.]|nr:cation transporter [Tardiphaga sp.]